MAANLKINLQDIVFRPKSEKLVHVLELAKPCIAQGEESPYLCVTAASDEELLWIYGTLEYPHFPEELISCFGSLDLFLTKEKDVKITYLITAEKITGVRYNINGVWLVKDLTVIDGKEAMQDNPRFDMHFEQVHTWEAFSTAAKYAFVRCVRELSKTTYGRDVEFVNFDNDFLRETGHFYITEDIMLTLKLCLQGLNCACFLGCV
ncbi:exocyst complex component 1-like [Alligator sinensis]|uniref:Exocyst complex component 1-like n=1 Tax=Alligator sinensis TaxID=38654 RepID=A0A3Q0GJI3_ALLSI|nr:exocyst complex component 1-like [Alligator sinensis]